MKITASLFTMPIDYFFTLKLLTGLTAMFSFCGLTFCLAALTGQYTGSIGQIIPGNLPMSSLLDFLFGVVAAGVFRFTERRRRSKQDQHP